MVSQNKTLSDVIGNQNSLFWAEFVKALDIIEPVSSANPCDLKDFCPSAFAYVEENLERFSNLLEFVRAYNDRYGLEHIVASTADSIPLIQLEDRWKTDRSGRLLSLVAWDALKEFYAAVDEYNAKTRFARMSEQEEAILSSIY